MNLNDLIKSAEEKLANPDLTLGTRRREEAIYHYLKAMKAENEVQQMAISELRAEKQELMDIIGRGKRYETLPAMVGETIKFYADDKEIYQTYIGGEVLYTTVVDKRIRHKWPEEKPEEEKEYLIRTEFTDDNQEDVYEACMVAEWQEKQIDGEWYSRDFEPGFYMQDDNDMWCHVDFVTHWWNLPEVE